MEINNSTVCFNYTTDDILKSEHVAFVTESFTNRMKQGIRLFEIVMLTIKHPQAPEHGMLQTLNKQYIKDIIINASNDYDNFAIQLFSLSQSNLLKVRSCEID